MVRRPSYTSPAPVRFREEQQSLSAQTATAAASRLSSRLFHRCLGARPPSISSGLLCRAAQRSANNLLPSPPSHLCLAALPPRSLLVARSAATRRLSCSSSTSSTSNSRSRVVRSRARLLSDRPCRCPPEQHARPVASPAPSAFISLRSLRALCLRAGLTTICRQATTAASSPVAARHGTGKVQRIRGLGACDESRTKRTVRA